VGDFATAEGRAGVGAGKSCFAVLLQSFAAGSAGAATVDETADPGDIAHLEARHRAADGAYAADDLVAGHAGVERVVPLVAGGVQVGMANPAQENVDLYVVIARLAALEAIRGERILRIEGGIALDFCHVQVSFRLRREMESTLQ